MFKYAAKDYFINAPEIELNAELSARKIDPVNIPSPFIALLLQKGNRNILIDTGIGYAEKDVIFRGNTFKFKGQTTKLLNGSKITCDDITDVVITHFHPDHIGGVFSEDNALNFTNATFHIHEKEWNFWHSSKSEGQPPLFKHFIEQNISPLSNLNLNLIKGDLTEIVPGITAVKAFGHTPGQMGLIIQDGNEKLLYLSDSFLHPLHIEHIDWQTNYDFDHTIAKKTRLKLLNMAYEEDMLVNAFHFDFPGLGRVGQSSSKWKWVAQR